MNTLEKILELPLPLPPFSEVLGTISKPWVLNFFKLGLGYGLGLN